MYEEIYTTRSYHDPQSSILLIHDIGYNDGLAGKPYANYTNKYYMNGYTKGLELYKIKRKNTIITYIKVKRLLLPDLVKIMFEYLEK